MIAFKINKVFNNIYIKYYLLFIFIIAVKFYSDVMTFKLEIA